ncbi:MAG: acyl-CoA dehydratase activase-related protein [Firmicutes bacterium]|nr:acyl-CoA dehydratase activase-related protein [Bacillota bacterium]
MKIGLPRAFLFHRYETLWTEFFLRLGHETVISPPTSRAVLAEGIKRSVDEACLPAKIFLGHVSYLIGKCDYILIPRIESFGKNEKTCVKFNALFDIARNTFFECPRRVGLSDSDSAPGAVSKPDPARAPRRTALITYNVDALKGKHEMDGFVRMGKMLGTKKGESKAAYLHAKKSAAEVDAARFFEELKKLFFRGNAHDTGNQLHSVSPLSPCALGAAPSMDTVSGFPAAARPCVMLVGHAYNLHDAFIGEPVVKVLQSLGAAVVFADRLKSPKLTASITEELTPGLYWTFQRELVNAVGLYRSRADGLVLITAFPCGPDALAHELMLRRMSDTPVCSLLVDELQGEGGVRTRLESFMDIIRMKNNFVGVREASPRSAEENLKMKT